MRQFKLVLALSVCLGLIAVTAVAQLASGQSATFPASAAATEPTTEPTSQPALDDWAPGLGIAAVVMVLFILVLLGFGAAVGLALMALTAVLVGVGVVSSSMLIGIMARKPRSAFRALFIQIGAITGIPVGIFVLWIIGKVLFLGLHFSTVVIAGGLGGPTCGVGAALMFNFAWGWVLRRVRSR